MFSDFLALAEFSLHNFMHEIFFATINGIQIFQEYGRAFASHVMHFHLCGSVRTYAHLGQSQHPFFLSFDIDTE